VRTGHSDRLDLGPLETAGPGPAIDAARKAPSLHWSDGYYGDLYRESTADLLTPALSSLEASVIARLLALRPGQRVLDLACGEGRHALLLAGRARVMGVDRSADYLRRAAGAGRARNRPGFVRADLRALPLPDGALDAVYSWYASLFMYDEAGNVAALGELARVLRPGGRCLVQHSNPLRLALEPVAAARRSLPDGSVVEEEATFDPATGVERAHRRLVRPDGSVQAGTAVLRHYRAEEWELLARGAGLRLLELTSTVPRSTGGSGAPGPEAVDLIAVMEKA